MKLRKRLLSQCLLAALALACGQAAADSWDIVVSDRGRQVEIDRASIIQSDNGTKVAWGRILLAEDEAAGVGYAAIKALNRYDCNNRSFYTIKRVYLDAQYRVLREEGVTSQDPVQVARRTVDERLWREVCRAPSAAELRKLAREASRSAESAQSDMGAAEPALATRTAAVKPQPAAVIQPAAAPAQAKPHEVREARSPSPSSVRRHTGETPDAPAVSAKPSAPAAAAAPAAPSRASAPRPIPSAVAPAVPQAPASIAMIGREGSERPPAAAKPAVPGAAPERKLTWSYEGETGPEHWGRLRPEWTVCAEGRRQSPIDLRNTIAVELEPVRFDYRNARFRIMDTGHTLEVQVGEGLGVEIRGQRYELTHLQFHRPSEKRLGGQASDMAVHLHHRDPEGRIAIVAVMLESGGVEHPLIQALWNNLPLEREVGYSPATMVDLSTLVPSNPAHYLYMGSLTTPPCTEGVLWVTMKEPIRATEGQLSIFARFYPRNSRPIQPQHGRVVLESR